MRKAKNVRVELGSLEECKHLADCVAQVIRRGDSVALIGDLGAGKTTFVRFFCGFLGVNDDVCSPSFVIANEYQGPHGLTVEHWDLYRLSGLPDELYEPVDDRTVRLVEWADRDQGWADSAELKLEWSFVSSGPMENSRKVILAGIRAECVLAKWRSK